jgi:hypothetical protein
VQKLLLLMVSPLYVLQVVYQEGNAVLLECDMKCVLESNPMLTCLQTKWPNVEVQWLSGITPSLN